jgi:tetratricopeptide (TPR) repeat protein
MRSTTAVVICALTCAAAPAAGARTPDAAPRQPSPAQAAPEPSAVVLDPTPSVICSGAASADLDMRIRACSSLLQGDALTPKERAAIYSNRGLVVRAKGDVSRAVKDYGHAIALDPDFAPAWYNRANAREELGNHTGAVADYDQAIRLRPGYGEAYNGRCWSRAQAKGDLDRALADCNYAVRLDPTNPSTRDSRALVLLMLGRYDQAVADYDQVISERPASASALYGRGFARIRLGDPPEGFSDVSAAVAIDKHVAKTFKKLGLVADPVYKRRKAF